MGPKYVHFFLILLCSCVFVTCKNHEKVSKDKSKAELSPCQELTANASRDSLFFVAESESKRESIATQRAEQESVIQLVQFFQTEFIEGMFRSYDRLGNQSTANELKQVEKLRKKWSEMSFEMIGEKHNQKAFTHRQKVVEDSSGTFTAYNVLVISEDWIRNHWAKSLSAVEEDFFVKAKESIQYKELMEMDIQQEQPCNNF